MRDLRRLYGIIVPTVADFLYVDLGTVELSTMISEILQGCLGGVTMACLLTYMSRLASAPWRDSLMLNRRSTKRRGVRRRRQLLLSTADYPPSLAALRDLSRILFLCLVLGMPILFEVVSHSFFDSVDGRLQQGQRARFFGPTEIRYAAGYLWGFFLGIFTCRYLFDRVGERFTTEAPGTAGRLTYHILIDRAKAWFCGLSESTEGVRGSDSVCRTEFRHGQLGRRTDHSKLW